MNKLIQPIHRFILPLLLLWASVASAQPRYIFEEVDGLEALPNNEIHALYQDSDGYVWIGSSGGIFQFDGYKIKSYVSSWKSPNLLTNNTIRAIVEDNDKHLFVGTDSGLNLLDKRTLSMRQIATEELNNIYISTITLDRGGRVWVGSDRGTYIYDIRSDSCQLIEASGLSRDAVKSLHCDSRGDMWIGTWDKGLYRYSMSEGRVYTYPKISDINSAHVIYEDSSNNIWVGSFGRGLFRLNNPYDMKRVSYTRYTRNNSAGKLSDNFIYRISESRKESRLLVGTRSGLTTLSTLAHDDLEQWHSIPQSFNHQELPPQSIDALMIDKQGNIWIGTLGSGVRCVKPNYQAFKTTSTEGESVRNRSIQSLYIDKNDNIWCGIGSIGVAVKYANSNELLPIVNSDDFMLVQSIVGGDEEGTLFLGTSSGLAILDCQRREIKKIDGISTFNTQVYSITSDMCGGYYMCTKFCIYHIDSDLKSNVVLRSKGDFKYLLCDEIGKLWVGNNTKGVMRISIDPTTKEVVENTPYNRENGRFGGSNINYIYKDSGSRLWLCTNDSGLFIYDAKEDRFVSINEHIDFPTNVISSIIEDSEGVLWIGSNVGIIKYFPSQDIRRSEFRLYSDKNGLSDKVFLPKSVAKNSRGELYFGTYRGYVYFDPKEVRTPAENGNVLITDIKLNNKYIDEIDSLSREAITQVTAAYATSINIPHEYTNFTLEFAPMSYFNPDNVRYAYKLDGYDSEWSYTSSMSRFAHYAQLPAGDYTFRLKSTNEYGTWNGLERVLNISIIPPIWLSSWAYLLYAIIFICIVTYAYLHIRQRVILRKKLRTIEVERDKEEAINQAKLRFFTNITHDLFTPITIVAAAIEEQQHAIAQSEYEIMMTNINRLTRLIQQILEFRKAESGNLKLYVTQEDITSIIAKNIESFCPLMKKKSIEIGLHSNRESQQGYIDIDKIDKILYNLLSNALKYNNEGAKVDVSLNYIDEDKSVEIRVADNGNGLTDRAMKSLFKRFYDGEFRKYHTTGTGIGLSLVHDLVTLHRGEIKVENHIGEGVCFIITLPISAAAYSDLEQHKELYDEPNPEVKFIASSTSELTTTLLVVEDNNDLRLLLSNILSQRYNVRTATNGVEALAIIEKEEIDIVVSDVMMPEMGGYELCRNIKSNAETNDIQLLLLTAKLSDDAAVEGYDSGADSFLTKPFSGKLLLSRIENLIAAREARAAKFKAQDIFECSSIEYTPYEEDFLNSVIELIKSQIGNIDLDQTYLTEQLGVSKSTLNRKIKSLTGMTSINFVNEIRMKSAYKLLQESGAKSRVSEIAFAVGFNSPKYFSTCFKKRFNITPSDLCDGE